jgi:Acyltransferase family.
MATVRNRGVDLLRLVSMLFVVVLHSLGRSGVLKTDADSGLYKAAWLIEIFCYGAVNIFALISGYVGYRDEKRPMKIRGLLKLWTQAVFYGLLFFAIVKIFDPTVTAKGDFVSYLMPILHGRYWYLTAYILVFLAAPVLNAGLRELSEEKCRKAIWVILGIGTVAFLTAGDLFATSKGYSAWWLMILYFIGGAMKKGKFLEKLNDRWCIFGIIACIGVTWLSKIYGDDVMILDFRLSKGFLVSYISPTVVFSSVLFMRLFAGLQMRWRWLNSAIDWAAPCAFAVYLLNMGYIYNYYLPKWLSPLCDKRILIAIPALIGFSVLFFVCAIFIEKGRQVAVAFLDKQISIRRKRCQK